MVLPSNDLVLLAVHGRHYYFHHRDLGLLESLSDRDPELDDCQLLEVPADSRTARRYDASPEELLELADENSDYLQRICAIALEQFGNPILDHLVSQHLFQVGTLVFILPSRS